MEENSVVRKFRITAGDGKTYTVIHYNLYMIISLGYRIKSKIATSIDYNPKSDEAKKFFATIQNKMHFAVHHHTASELIYNRVDAD